MKIDGFKYFASQVVKCSQFKLENVGKAISTCLPPLPEVSQLLKLYQVKAVKHLSQNFLHNPPILNRFVNCIDKSLRNQYVCEVGPGPGSITRTILSREPEQLVIVEKDQRFLPMLQYVADVADGRVKIIHGDIMEFDMKTAFPAAHARPWEEDSPPFAICGNLPFNVSLPLLFSLLSQISAKNGVFSHGRIPMVFTFQQEVAERLVAGPGDFQRSRVSVTSQYLCDSEYRFTIRGSSFVPPPKVDVGVVRITPKRQFLMNLPFKTVDHVVKHAMHNRRKNCEQGIRTLFPPARADLVDEIFRISQVPGHRCGFQLDNLHFRDLCLAFEQIADRIPQLRLIDTFDPKEWSRKYFDDRGFPLEDL